MKMNMNAMNMNMYMNLLSLNRFYNNYFLRVRYLERCKNCLLSLSSTNNNAQFIKII